jgi:hypothetical protein
MMLTPLTFNYDQCVKEAQELKTFLGSHTSKSGMRSYPSSRKGSISPLS